MQKPEIRMLILRELKCNPLKSEITYALKHLQKVIWNDFIQKKKKKEKHMYFLCKGLQPSDAQQIEVNKKGNNFLDTVNRLPH